MMMPTFHIDETAGMVPVRPRFGRSVSLSRFTNSLHFAFHSRWSSHRDLKINISAVSSEFKRHHYPNCTYRQVWQVCAARNRSRGFRYDIIESPSSGGSREMRSSWWLCSDHRWNGSSRFNRSGYGLSCVGISCELGVSCSTQFRDALGEPWGVLNRSGLRLVRLSGVVSLPPGLASGLDSWSLGSRFRNWVGVSSSLLSSSTSSRLKSTHVHTSSSDPGSSNAGSSGTWSSESAKERKRKMDSSISDKSGWRSMSAVCSIVWSYLGWLPILDRLPNEKSLLP